MKTYPSVSLASPELNVQRLVFSFGRNPRVEKRRVQVPIPPGISDGQTLRLSLGGNQVHILMVDTYQIFVISNMTIKSKYWDNTEKPYQKCFCLLSMYRYASMTSYVKIYSMFHMGAVDSISRMQ
jgi:hypothetical protein